VQEAYRHTESGLGFYFYLITRDQVAPPIQCFIHWRCARYKLLLWLWLWLWITLDRLAESYIRQNFAKERAAAVVCHDMQYMLYFLTKLDIDITDCSIPLPFRYSLPYRNHLSHCSMSTQRKWWIIVRLSHFPLHNKWLFLIIHRQHH